MPSESRGRVPTRLAPSPAPAQDLSGRDGKTPGRGHRGERGSGHVTRALTSLSAGTAPFLVSTGIEDRLVIKFQPQFYGECNGVNFSNAGGSREGPPWPRGPGIRAAVGGAAKEFFIS